MKRRYRPDQDGKRRLVYIVDTKFGPIEGYWSSFTRDCTGCTEWSEGSIICGPIGCYECGYHGKRRDYFFMPFDLDDIERIYL